MKNIVIGIGAVVTLLVFGVIVEYVSLSNQDHRLRNQISAQQDTNQVIYDKTWKIIQEQANVADQYKEAFAQIYPALMEGRYGNARGGALMSFIQESNPNFDPRLYEKVANSIEAQRTEFASVQKTLRAYKQESDNLLDTFPGSFFLSGRPKVEVTLVTSTKTEKAFQTGKDDELLVKPAATKN